ncbi:MAG: hypothetical protein SGPRY_002770 [Prymnesium sp.]
MAAPLLPAAAAADSWVVFALLSTSATLGLEMGKTQAGRTISGPICAMGIMFAAAALGILPPASSQVLQAQSLAVRLATPLLLLGTDLRAVASKAGKLLPAFLVGSVGTLAGTLTAIALLRSPLAKAFGAGEGLKVACALAAKNIGGGINFVAVSGALGLSPAAVGAALAADNVMALLYFPMCSWLGREQPEERISSRRGEASLMGGERVASSEGQKRPLIGETKRRGKIDFSATDASQGSEAPRSSVAVEEEMEGRMGAAEQSACLSVALCVGALSQHLAGAGYDVPLATMLTVGLATLAPRLMRPLSTAGDQMGTLVLYLFFASAGWTGGGVSSSLMAGGPVLLSFLLILYTVHLSIIAAVGELMRRSRFFRLPLLLVASNANIGGPATASALAKGNGWPSLVTPALLVGNLGYVVATPVCLLLFSIL